MGKCLFFDADGTILDIVKGTPEDTKLALQQLRKNGHKTFICTGRSNAFVPEYLMKEIGFDGLIANLGATLRGADYMNFDMGKIYMMITVAIVPIIIVYLLLSKYIIAGVTLGGVKE